MIYINMWDRDFPLDFPKTNMQKSSTGKLVSPETSPRHPTEKRQPESRERHDRQTFRGLPAKRE